MVLKSYTCDLRVINTLGVLELSFYMMLFMAALRSRCRRSILPLWLLPSSSFSSPVLSGRRVDVYHTSTHGVALVRI